MPSFHFHRHATRPDVSSRRRSPETTGRTARPQLSALCACLLSSLRMRVAEAHGGAVVVLWSGTLRQVKWLPLGPMEHSLAHRAPA